MYSSRNKLARPVARIEEGRIALKILIDKPTGKRLLKESIGEYGRSILEWLVKNLC